jgi:hypothetical protein
MSAQELLETPGLGRCELLHGELIRMTPAGFEHLDPESLTNTVYHGPDQVQRLGSADTLTDDAVIPGFRVPVGDVFSG